jgi:pimeloyl-ACP methyl ester carboxylesterase
MNQKENCKLVTRPISPVFYGLVFGAFFLIVLIGCAHKVGVYPVDFEKRYEEMSRSALDSGSPSERTMLFLRQRDLIDAWKRDPIPMLTELDWMLHKVPGRETLFALMELCYLEAHRAPKLSDLMVKLYRSCTLYAYNYLFDPGFGPSPSSYHPHSRLACEFYNRSLAAQILYNRNRNIGYGKNLRLPLLRGSVELVARHSELAWAPDEFDRYFVAYEFEVEGLAKQHRSFGLGVPLIAVYTPPPLEDRRTQDRFLPKIQLTFPATGFVKIDPLISQVQGEPITYRAEILAYDPFKTRAISIGGRTAPLETDFTTALAYWIDKAPPPKKMKGFFNAEAWADRQGLFMFQPFQSGKIPVVFVHGLTSSPATWLLMFNDLLGDPQIRERYQFWYFRYPTGNPTLYSASILRDSLMEISKVYDPAGTNPAFNQMVLVGHSMGGLLSKTMVQQSGDLVWRMLFDKPIDDLDIPVEQRSMLERVLFFEPLPFVSRVIFIAVPHRGSKLARMPIVEMVQSIVKPAPQAVELTKGVISSLGRDTGPIKELLSRRMSTGVDSLRPDSPMLQTLAEIPIDPDVTYHSIIGNQEAADTLGGTDGVVPYDSAHLEGAASEKIVRSDHGVHTHPVAIEEVKRILREHLAEIDHVPQGGKKPW